MAKTILRHAALPLCLPFLTIAAVAAEDAVLAPVVTSASRTERLATDVPVAAFAIDEKEIQKRNVGSLEEIIDRTPGVIVRRTKGMNDAAPGIYLRGVPDAKRSLILLDGVPVNDGYAGSQKMMGFAPEDVKSVEVVLGPASSLYGNNAMGGVVSFFTRMPDRRELRYAVGYGDTWSGERGLHNLLKTYVSYGDKFDSGLKLFVSASRASADGAVQDMVTSGAKPAASVTGWTLMPTTAGGNSYVIGDKGLAPAVLGQISLRAEYSLGGVDSLWASYKQGFQSITNDMPNSYVRQGGRETFSPAGTTLGFGNFIGIRQETSRQFMSVGLDKKIGGSLVKIKAAHTKTDYWYLTGVDSKANWDGGPAQKVYNPSTTDFAEAQINTPLGERHLLTWGATFQLDNAQAHRYNLANWRKEEDLLGERIDQFKGKTQTLGFFLQDEWSLGPSTTVFMGARYDLWRGSDGYAYQVGNPALDGLSYAKRKASALSPRAGVVHHFSPAWTVRASLGSAFRAPNVFDLYRPFPTSSANGTYTGNNPNLKPETLRAFDVGTDVGLWQGATLKATAYVNQFADMMYNKPIASLADARTVCPGIVAKNFNTAAGQKCVQKTNVGAARSQGIELALQQKFTAAWSANLMLTKMQSRIVKNEANPLSEGRQFTAVPHQSASFGVQYQDERWSGNLTAKYQGRSWSSSDDLNTQNTWNVLNSYDAFTVVDAKVAYRFAKQATLSLAVDNLLDKKAYNYSPIYGRSWFLQLSGEF